MRVQLALTAVKFSPATCVCRVKNTRDHASSPGVDQTIIEPGYVAGPHNNKPMT